MIQNIITLSLLIAVVIFLRAVFRKKIPARLIYALWLAVVIKLCIPVSLLPVLPEPVKPEAPFSHDVPTVSVDSETDKTPPLYEVTDEHAVQPTHSDITPEYSPSLPNVEPYSPTTPVSQTPDVQPIGDITEPAPVTPSEKPAVDYTRVLFIAWGVLSAAVALFFAVTGTVFSVKLHRTREYVGKVKRFKVYTTSAVSTPCVSGLYPTIYITPDMKDGFSDSLALTHELTHIRHGDNFWAIFRIAALVVYPWNPLVWAAAILSKRDSEFACDESVTKKMNKNDRLGYAQMLVDSASAKPRGVVGLGSAPLEERIKALVENRKDRMIFIIVAVVLAAAVVLCSFLGFKKSDAVDESTHEDTVADTGENEDGSEDSDTDHAEKYLSVKVINEGECSVKLVTAEDCTLIESYPPYFRKEGKTYVILPDAFSGNLYSYVTNENGNAFCYTIDLSTSKSHSFSTDSNASLSDSIITGGALFIAPASFDSDGKEKIFLYKNSLLSGSTESITDIPVSDTRVDISALDDDSIVFLVNRRDGEDTVPTVYRCNNNENTVSVVFESRDSDEKICCIDAYGGQIYAVTVKDDNGWKIHSLKTYSRDGALISSDEFRALDSIVQQNEYKYYYMEYFGDYISMKLERDGYFINSPTFEKTDDGYRAISFSYTGMANTTMAESANRHYYTVGINSSLGQIAVIDTEKHEPSFIRFDMGKDKTVSSEKIYCNEDGKLLFVTTDTDGNEQLWEANDSLEEIVLNGKPGRITVTADSFKKLKKYVDDGTLGQSGEDYYDYLYSFFIEGWKFPEVNNVRFSDISFSFTYPFVNTDGIDIDFTIVESPLEELKPGKYSIKVAEGMMDFYITGLNEEKTEKTRELNRKYEEVHKLLLFFNSCRLWNTPAYGKGVTYPGAMDFVHVYYGETGNWYKLDEESLYRHLEEDFGVTEPEKLTVRGTLLGDGQYNSLYECYPQEQRSVLDVKETSDGIEVTVRFYADTEMLIRSHLIVYYFDKDSRFNGYTVLEKGKYEPAGIHFIPDDGLIRTNEVSNLKYYVSVGMFDEKQYKYYNGFIDGHLREYEIYNYLITFEPKQISEEPPVSYFDFTVQNSKKASLPDGEYHRKIVGSNTLTVTDLDNESGTEEEPEFAFYFYRYNGDRVYATDNESGDKNDVPVYTYKCKTVCAKLITYNSRYAYIEDEGRFFIDITTGERIKNISGFDIKRMAKYMLLGGDSTLLTFFDTVTQKYFFFDILTDQKVREHIYNSIYTTADGRFVLCYDFNGEHELSDKTKSYVFEIDGMKEILSGESYITDLYVGKRTLFIDRGNPLENNEFCDALYSEKGEKLIDSPFSFPYIIKNERLNTEKILIWEKVGESEKYRYYICDADLKREYESREYDGFYGMWGEYQAVLDGSSYRFVKYDETVSLKICDNKDGLYFHNGISGSKSGNLTDKNRINRYEINVGDAENPIFEPSERPECYPDGLNFVFEDTNAEEGQPGRGYEYVVSTENGIIGRFVLSEIGGYS